MKGCTVHSCQKKSKLHSTVVFGVDVTKIHPPQNWENVYLLSPSCPRYVHYKSRPLMRTIKRTDNQKKTVLRCCKYSGKQWWQVKFRHRRQPRLICRMSFFESRVKHEICFHPVCWENQVKMTSVKINPCIKVTDWEQANSWIPLWRTLCCTTIQKGHFSGIILSYFRLAMFFTVYLSENEKNMNLNLCHLVWGGFPNQTFFLRTLLVKLSCTETSLSTKTGNNSITANGDPRIMSNVFWRLWNLC